jgi:hypothetical protein
MSGRRSNGPAWLPALCAAAIVTATGAACSPGAATFDRTRATAAVSSVLDQLHHNASVADEEAYFTLFAPEAIFLGTDATERWTVQEFRAYAHPYFAAGRGWTYVVRSGTRHCEFDPTGRVAWFDEILDNAHYGETRGTGVLRLIDGDWKIAQYHLTIPVPNALADSVVRMIQGMEGRPGS